MGDSQKHKRPIRLCSTGKVNGEREGYYSWSLRMIDVLAELPANDYNISTIDHESLGGLY